ncbi:MAG: DUF1761 domain-containing protein [Fluviicola sp.]|jgi:hypothetical protein
MIQFISAINWLSVLVALVAYSALGALWFTLLFKKQYAKSLGKENENLQNSAPIFIIGPMICSLLITITCALLIHALGIQTITGSLEFAAIVGIGYLFSNTVNIAINPNMPRPIPYGIISGMFHLVGMLIVCSILVSMK